MKTSFSALALAAALLLGSANAHVKLKSPVPFRASTGAPQNAAQQDFDMTAPLDKSGSNFPCKGYHKDAQGTQPLVDWPAGSTQVMSFEGQATHGGGSCQASLSEDEGVTWKVMKSYVGGCPLKDASFTVPKEAKSGAAIFSWSWFNNQGNREMYMNCAAVTITGGGSGLSAHPDMFTANIGNDCTTVEGSDVAFPDPGEDVEGSGGAPPTGSGCGATGSQPPAGGSPPSGGSPSSAQVTGTPSAPTGGLPSSAPTTGKPSAPTGGPSSSAPITGTPSAPTGGPSSSAPITGTPSAPTGSSPSKVAGGPGGNNPNPSPSSSSAPRATPPVPTASSPNAASTSAPTGTPKTSAPAPSTAPSPYPQPPTGGTCVEGAITCNADGTWSQCGSGVNHNMGKIAPGTNCANDRMKAIKIKRSIRFSGEHMARNA
ncbi:unnamed protein product [Tuber aestivum]|uniref:Spore coat protein SP96 n=1 Tax=Tuber aestivum TaxID=59557 RepID=A0A292Q3Q3_9PEZI|nr:unnamed protein product [Tuber aestivum]